MSKRLNIFFEEWEKKIRRGEVSSFGRLEVIVLEIYDDWITEYLKKKNEGELKILESK